MDFTKNCATNVRALDGFASVHFFGLAIQRPKGGYGLNHATEKPFAAVDLAHLEKAILPIREKGGLIMSEPSQPALWVFARSETRLFKVIEPWMSSDTSYSPLRPVTGSGPPSMITGVFKASDLLECDDLGNHNVSDVLSFSNVKSLIARASKINAIPSSGLPIRKIPGEQDGAGTAKLSKNIYSLFVNAYLNALAFAVSRNHDMAVLSLSTYLINSPLPDALWHDRRSSKITLSVDLTISGSLLVCVKSSPTFLVAANREASLVGTAKNQVLLAPLGIQGTFIQDEIQGPDVFLNDDAGANDHDELNAKSNSPCVIAWKAEVLQWLAHRGFFRKHLQADVTWVRISVECKTAQIRGLRSLGNREPSSLCAIWWPATLCFYRKTAPITAHAQVHESPEDQPETRFTDPLGFAINWLTGMDTRDKAAIIIDNPESTNVHDLSFVCSSDEQELAFGFIHTQESAMDVMGPTGIYPTPPDAFAAQGSTHVSPEVRDANDGHRLYHSNKHNTSHDTETGQSNLRKGSLIQNDNSSPTQAIFGNDNDDLFETDGITEADFSFFDEPDDSLSFVVDHEKDTINPSQFHPMSPLKHEDIKKSGVNNGRSFQDNSQLSSRHGMLPNAVYHRLMETSGSPPLTPLLVEHILFSKTNLVSGPIKLHSLESERDNLDAIKFDTRLLFSDEKYRDKGCFGTIEHKLASDSLGAELLSPGSCRTSIVPLTSQKRRLSTSNREYPQARLGRTINAPDVSHERMRIDSCTSADTSRDNDLPMSSRHNSPQVPLEEIVGNKVVEGMTTASIHDCISCGKKVAQIFHRISLLEQTTKSCEDAIAAADTSETHDLHRTVHGTNVDDLIAVAQLICDQLASTTIKQFEDVLGSHEYAESAAVRSSLTTRRNGDCLSDIVHGVPQSLVSLASMVEPPVKANTVPKLQPKQTARRANMPRHASQGGDSNSSHQELISRLEPPHLRVSRADARGQSLWSILPTALKFSETLGLGPCNSVKNVQAYCVFDPGYASGVGVLSFLDAIGAAYENGKLGTHVLGPGVMDFEDGLIPTNDESGCSLLAKACITTIAQSKPVAANTITVIYFVNSKSTTTGFYNVCNTFRTFEGALGSLPEFSQSLVLQVLPLKAVADVDALTIPEPQAAIRLAKEVYDRCPGPVLEQGAGTMTNPPSIELEEVLPPHVQFNLLKTPISALGGGDSSIHVAYSISPNEDWIVVSWVHRTGKFSTCVPYCLRGSQFARIAEEIWVATMSARPHTTAAFSVYIAKVGVMELPEQQTWQGIIRNQNDCQGAICVLSVNVDPDLQLSLQPSASERVTNMSPTSSSALDPQPVAGGVTGTLTSVSTPQSTGFTPPETPPSGHRQKPLNQQAVDSDSYAQLLDVTDIVWAVVLGHRINVSTSSLRLHRALASGYLVKRSAVGGVEPPPVLCEVNVMFLHSNRQASTGSTDRAQDDDDPVRHDDVLREVLRMYRNLGTLAIVRGVTDEKDGVVPWHVATARRAAVGLGLCMPMGSLGPK